VKTPEYREGPEALRNFKREMIALFKVPKSAVERPKKQLRKNAASQRERSGKSVNDMGASRRPAVS
jgi:hypothetical protein